MNETIRNIVNRRSIRKFMECSVGEAEIRAILEAGQSAPSAKNEQPWHFTIVQDKVKLEKLSDACLNYLIETENPVLRKRLENSDMCKFDLFYHAPMLVIISGYIHATQTVTGCTLAAENMMIASESLGLGSCWIEAVKLYSETKGGREFLEKNGILLPDNKVIASLAIGYKADRSQTAIVRKKDNVTYL
jgi:nitroreductase